MVASGFMIHAESLSATLLAFIYVGEDYNDVLNAAYLFIILPKWCF